MGQPAAGRIQRSSSESGNLRKVVKSGGTGRQSLNAQPPLQWFDDRRGSVLKHPDTRGADADRHQADPRTPRSACSTPRATHRRSLSQSSLTSRGAGGRSSVTGPKMALQNRSEEPCAPSSVPVFLSGGGAASMRVDRAVERAPERVARPADVGAAPRAATPTEVTPSTCSKPTPKPSGQGGSEITAEVSSLVETLEAVRAQALASGGRLPRAVEAAASALEPLLRLRDVTGAFAFDVSLMPWLPQLLAVFRTVLHTAVDGGRSKAQAGIGATDVDGSIAGADDCAAGMGAAAATAAAAAAAAMVALGGSSGGTDFKLDADAKGDRAIRSASLFLECEALRKRVRQLDAQLLEAKAAEKSWRQMVDELRHDKIELTEKVRSLERDASTDCSLDGGATTCRRDSDLSVASDATGEWIAKRMCDIDSENRAFRAETKMAEERMGELAALIRTALEDDPKRGHAPAPLRSAAALREDGDGREVARRGGSTTPRSRGAGTYLRARKSLAQQPGPRDANNTVAQADRFGLSDGSGCSDE